MIVSYEERHHGRALGRIYGYVWIQILHRTDAAHSDQFTQTMSYNSDVIVIVKDPMKTLFHINLNKNWKVYTTCERIRLTELQTE